MNKLITLFAAFGLLLAFDGCASSPGYYDSYDNHGGYSGHGGYGGGGYNNGYGSRSNHSESSHKQDGPSKQETAVKALQDAAKNGADPSTTLYQQMLIQQR